MADSAQDKPSRSQADKERSRQQSRQVNAREAAKSAGGRGTVPPKSPKGGNGAPPKGGNGSTRGGGSTAANGPGRSAGRGAAANRRPQAGQRPSNGRRPASARGGRSVRRPVAPGGSRSSTALLTWGVVAVVLVIVVVLVVVKVVGGGGTGSSTAVKPGPVPASIVNEVTHVPSSVYDTVGTTSTTVTVTAPTVETNQSTLTITGKPAFFFMGGEYCPYCAAERWAVIASLSRFGTFSGLETMASAATDYAGNTQTFTFLHAKYKSQYLTAALREVYSNVKTPTGRAYEKLESLTKQERSIVKRYGSSTSSTSSGTIPFMDVGNKLIFSGASYSPMILQGLSRSQIAGDLSNPKNPVTQAIITTSNYISAGICSMDGGQPAAVCNSKGVTAAAKALGLSI